LKRFKIADAVAHIGAYTFKQNAIKTIVINLVFCRYILQQFILNSKNCTLDIDAKQHLQITYYRLWLLMMTELVELAVVATSHAA